MSFEFKSRPTPKMEKNTRSINETGKKSDRLTNNPEKTELRKQTESQKSSELNNPSERKSFLDLISPKETYLTSMKERVDRMPRDDSPNGFYKDSVFHRQEGDGKFIPYDTPGNQEVISILKEAGTDGLKYRNGWPDFSPVAKENVKIDMTSERGHNFDQADQKLSEKWNKLKKDGKNDWDPNSIRKYRRENKLSWHEHQDGKTCQLIDRSIHEFYTHAGGVCEMKKREELSKGGLDHDHTS